MYDTINNVQLASPKESENTVISIKSLTAPFAAFHVRAVFNMYI